MRIRSLLRYSLAALAVVAATAAFPSASHAVVFDLTSDHCDGAGGCLGNNLNGGSVTVTQNGANVDITVDLATGFSFVKTGAVDFLAFKFNAVGIVLGDITVNQNAVGQTLAPAGPGAFNGDGTGNFNWGINCTTCGGGASTAFSTDIIFHVANATIADLTAVNNLGNIFVADLLGPTGNTGPVDASTPRAVPGPIAGAGIPGLVVACGGLLALARRRRKIVV